MARQTTEKSLEILETPPEVRELVRECELTGRRTLFQRDGRAVAILVSYDEYLALRETIEIGNDADLRTRIDAALPPSAAGALERFVNELWKPTIDRPVVAPKLHEAEVVFVGEKLVLVRAGSRSVTLPWQGAALHRGDRIKVGITAHGKPKLALVTAPDGRVTVIDF